MFVMITVAKCGEFCLSAKCTLLEFAFYANSKERTILLSSSISFKILLPVAEHNGATYLAIKNITVITRTTRNKLNECESILIL